MTASRELTIGYTPLCDSAPLIAAAELGFFAEEGLSVTLARQNSWATARDFLQIGALDAAHMLAPAVVSNFMSGGRRDFFAPMAISLNGTTIALSGALFDEIQALDPAAAGSARSAAAAVGRVAPLWRAKQGRPLTFAAVFPHSSHNLDLRRWLRAGGLDPDADASVVIVPPAEVEHFVQKGLVDGFCVGEPWGSLAARRGSVRIVATSLDLRPNRIEKVIAVRTRLGAEQPETLRALMVALLRAAQWADEPANRSAMASLFVRGGYIEAPAAALEESLSGRYLAADGAMREVADLLVFHRYAANFPWLSEARTLADSLCEAGLSVAREGNPEEAFAPDLYRRVAEETGVAAPLLNHKPAAGHADAWVLSEATKPIPMGRDQPL